MKRTMIKVKPIVKSILVKDERARDDDRRLQVKVWAGQYPDIFNKENLQNNPAFRDFIGLFLGRKLIDEGSIRRMRRKLQEEEVELRGSLYCQRHKEEEEVRKYFREDEQLRFM